MSSSFRHDAERFLRRHAVVMVRHWLTAEMPGTWHPNGFAVFHVGAAENLGRLRLHAWPTSRRIALEGQPAIHGHPWDICSLVLVGHYQDTVFETREIAPDAGAGGQRFQAFALELGKPGEGDRVYPVDRWFTPVRVETRVFAPGEMHFLPAGRVHETTIPPDEFVATLLLTGKPYGEVQLLGNGGFGDRTYVRPPVSPADIASIKARLAAWAAAEAARGPHDGRG